MGHGYLSVCLSVCQAISNATEDIEQKFVEMMKSENFDILEFYGRQKKLFEPARSPVDPTQSFAVLVKPAIADAALAAANNTGVRSSPAQPLPHIHTHIHTSSSVALVVYRCSALPCPALLLH